MDKTKTFRNIFKMFIKREKISRRPRERLKWGRNMVHLQELSGQEYRRNQLNMTQLYKLLLSAGSLTVVTTSEQRFGKF